MPVPMPNASKHSVRTCSIDAAALPVAGRQSGLTLRGELGG